MLYLSYGILGGVGLGIGYIAPVSTLVKWFPDKRGLATGLAIMGFGFAVFIAGPIMRFLIASVGIADMFYILGTGYLLLMLLSSQYLGSLAEGWLPESFHKKLESGKKIIPDLDQMTAKESLRTLRFYVLWLMLFINITYGIAIIAVASPMAQETVGITLIAAAFMVGLMGLFNGGGRISPYIRHYEEHCSEVIQ